MASYCQYAHGRLRDSSKYHAKCKGSVGALFEPKISKNHCVTTVSFMLLSWDPLGLHLNRKYLKSDQKWPSYGLVTNDRLCDSSEYHAGCIGSFRAVFEPKRSKIGQETAEFWPIYNWEVA